jgi:hypothetical protein
MDFVALFADVALDTIGILQNGTEGWTGDGGDDGFGGGLGMGMGDNGTTWDGMGNGTIISPIDAGDVGVPDEGSYVLVRVCS